MSNPASNQVRYDSGGEVRATPAVAQFVDVATNEHVGIEPDNSPKRSTKHVQLIKNEGITPALAVVARHVLQGVGKVVPHRQRGML